MLITRGARINATNMGDDTALHLSSAHGHRDIVLMLLHNKANINAVNEHGNTPLHYACFWIAEELVNNGALVAMANKNGDTPLEKATPQLGHMLQERAGSLGQNLTKVPFKDRSWLGYKTRSRDATLSRNAGIELSQLKLNARIGDTHGGEVWGGKWQGNDIVAKILRVRECSTRVTCDFKEEFPRLRIFNLPNVLPVLGVCNQPPNLVVISQHMPFGSLYNVLHLETGIVVDMNQALRFSMDIARGMEFLHSMEPMIPNMLLTSKHVMIDEDLAKINVDDPKYQSREKDNGGLVNGIDEDLTARINMADYRYSFHERGKEYNPAWIAPEALLRKPSEINQRAADMWSYAILLWELATQEVPFADLSPMETGMKVALEGVRVTIPPGTPADMSLLIKICMHEDAGKRPRYDMVIPILEKMKAAG